MNKGKVDFFKEKVGFFRAMRTGIYYNGIYNEVSELKDCEKDQKAE